MTTQSVSSAIPNSQSHSTMILENIPFSDNTGTHGAQSQSVVDPALRP
jgi:hypothetical protein